MTVQPTESVRRLTLAEWVVILAVAAIVGAMCLGGVFGLPLYFLFAWVFYLRGVALPAIRPAWDQVAVFALSVALMTLLLHRLLRGWNPENPPPPGTAVRIVGLVLVGSVAGIACIGATHQVGWLVVADEPWLVRNYGHPGRQYRSSLQAMGVGTYNHTTENGALPAGLLTDRYGDTLHGWPTLLLPYVEQEALARRIDLTRPWDDPANARAIRTPVRLYQHPYRQTDTVDGLPAIRYAGNVHVLGGPRPFRKADVDAVGESNVLLYGEVPAHFRPWAYPWHLRDPNLGLNHPRGFGTASGGDTVQILMLDGSAHTMRIGTDDKAFRAMSGARR